MLLNIGRNASIPDERAKGKRRKMEDETVLLKKGAKTWGGRCQGFHQQSRLSGEDYSVWGRMDRVLKNQRDVRKSRMEDYH